MSDSRHWDRVYGGKADEELSWFQRNPERSLALIERFGPGRSARLIDAGAGTSPLLGELLRRGYRDLWWLDLSPVAQARAQRQLGEQAAHVHWVLGDVTGAALPTASFDVWHDRAVFHFLAGEAGRSAYVRAVARALRSGGHLIIATFAEDGAERCSGLPVCRYDADTLAAVFADPFGLLHSERELHRTPGGAVQSFRYCVLRRRADRSADE
ncbi:class I SAM-dependent methyltransferase [endosymbiont of unidentified scaly snail isolate Monju]|uniref:class I SAM-dependent methyltransferase n=1 Tax=endosymbiont of unidentified scaly snail isolate Monju TaxID=1248727 RepID=UPI00038923B5|nr:class I SAM-dependent methyltransferase [endosymbiont of unidentified scaly snail isolate Monju]BAN69617.1 methyltransferase type 12 [endosymbiont of unidentified scaly snail isolate Monju]